MSTEIRNIILAHGTEADIRAYVDSGKIIYPAYLWFTDKRTYNFLNDRGEIETSDFPKLIGTAQNEIILSELSDGICYIQGKYRIVESSDQLTSAAYVMVVVSDNGSRIRHITATDFDDYTIENGEITSKSSMITEDYLEDHGYATEDYVNDKISAMAISLEEDLVNYINEQLPGLVQAEIDNQVLPIIGDISELETEAKDNLVDAINEAAKSGSTYSVDDSNLIIS